MDRVGMMERFQFLELLTAVALHDVPIIASSGDYTGAEWAASDQEVN
jgi:hypothetical protein